ncbi:MAG: M14 family metallopeptidase [Longimicrobiales bacterium]
MRAFRRILPAVLAVLLVAASSAPSLHAQQIPSPEEFFGHQMGADRMLVGWEQLVEYYQMIGQRSDRVDVRVMGESTRGRPFLVIFVTSPENHRNLASIKEMNALLQDPRGASQGEIDRAIAQSKAVMVQSYALHSTEVAASQASAEIIYEMATRTDDEWMRVLDEVVAIQFPSLNPDGVDIVNSWYNRWKDTEYEAVSPPELYHHYIGHDNNRDAFMQNTVESQYGGEIMFREWIPQAYVDHHQMGPFGARMYVPPYAEPIRPEGDPLVWREMTWYGAQMAYGLEEAGREGVIGNAIYSGWGHFGFHWITPFHNIAGMLTESASARLATPLYVAPEQLQGSRQLPEYEAQTTFPNPWEGGWWTVRDIVVNQKIATFELLEIASKNRETILRNAWLKASRQSERGAEGEPVAFVIPAEQHDPLTMEKMIQRLLWQGIEVQEASDEFVHEGRVYGAGTYVVTMAQPKRGVIRWLLGRTFYPQNSYTRRPDGSPIRPYDMSGDVMAEFMGVHVDPVRTAPDAPLRVVSNWMMPEGRVARGSNGFHVEGTANDAFRAVNMLWDEGVTVRRFVRDHGPHAAGSWWVPDVSDAVAGRVARETGVTFHAMNVSAGDDFAPVAERQRVAMFQAYGGNMDEGWTRLVLERFGFPYTTIKAEDVAGGNLGSRFDVIILPEDNLSAMRGDNVDEDQIPPGYREGFGEEGVDALEAFVAGGGRLVTFGGAGELPIEAFDDFPVVDIVDGVPNTEFWAHGSTLRVNVDTSHPLAWGMPDRTQVVFFGDNQVYEVQGFGTSQMADKVVTYVDRDLLQSGQLDGEDLIASRAALLQVDHGDGDVVLIGFRTQHRGQTHGTFKFLFNSLVMP